VGRAITFPKWVLGKLTAVVVARKTDHPLCVLEEVFSSLVYSREMFSKPFSLI